MGTSDGYGISKAQLANLGNLVCERFCAEGHEIENRAIIEAFKCKGNVGKGLVERALTQGFEDDRSGKCAYYIVKSRAGVGGVGYMFFSLRCGSLFDSEMAKNWYQDEKDRLDALLKKAIDSGDVTRKLQVEKKIAELNDVKEGWKKDWCNEAEEGLLRVKNSFGGIELVHFCKNDAVWEMWSTQDPPMGNPPRKMGEVLFWHFIVERILKVVDVIGAELFYLFAADDTEEQKLCAYYRSLGFKGAEDFNFKCLKPQYDFTCIFMLCKVSELRDARQNYFADFNRSAYDVI